MYCFFLPSHTSIWSQPNDCGVDKCFHMCIERATRYKRQEGNEPTTSYFNKIFFEAWQMFISMESEDVLYGYNNATGAFQRTGLYQFDPCSETWEDATVKQTMVRTKSSGKYV